MIDKLLFAFDDQVKEHEEEIVVTVKERNKFKDVKLDAKIKLIDGWLEKFFEHIDVGLKVVIGMVKNLETEESNPSAPSHTVSFTSST